MSSSKSKLIAILQELQGKISLARALHYSKEFTAGQHQLSEAFTLCELSLTLVAKKERSDAPSSVSGTAGRG